jgi:hypothetical protein
MTSRIDIFDKSRGGARGMPSGGSAGGSPNGAETAPRSASPARRRAVELVAARLGGESVRDGSSSVFRVEHRLPMRSFHGCVRFELIESLDPGLLRILFPRMLGSPSGPDALAAPAFSDLVFFDIETTGLSGGAGTLVFLAGVARILETEIRLTQYFMENLSSERLFLSILKEELGSGGALVSYNGRRFDSSIIKNRLILNGFRPSEPEPLHLDLLYPSRRIWKGRLPDFSLQTVERGVLKVERDGDVPGYRIPEIYFQYLREEGSTRAPAARGLPGRGLAARELLGVFAHNRLDSLSLLALLVRQLGLIRTIVGQRGPAGEGMNTWKCDLPAATKSVATAMPRELDYNPAALSDLLVSGDLSAQARKLLQRHSEDADALRRLGLLCKREGLYADARAAFADLLCRTRGLREYVFACTELAKICEHGLKDIRAAQGYAEMAMRRIERARMFEAGDGGGAREGVEREIEDVRKRLVRLERRLRLAR